MELDKIKLNPNNPRFIKDDNFKKLVKSLIELPVMTELREIVVDEDNVIIGGNMRYRAAKEAGWKEIPTKVFTRAIADENNKLTNQTKTYEDYCKEIMIKDNISGGEWDWELLSSSFEKDELEDWGLDIDKWKDDDVVEDEVPEVTENPVSKLCEVYQLGRHRLMCGDSTKIEDVEKLMDGKKADMVFTDPPYGLGGYGGRNNMDLKGDDEDVKKFYDAVFNLVPFLNKKEMYIWGNALNLKNHLQEDPRDVIVWVKNNFGLGSGYRGQYELCFYYGDFKGSDSDVWQENKDTDYQHPTQKPVNLSIRAIKNSNPNIVLDIFSGSGSTLIACEQTNRICYGMEIDPKYCDVIRKRYAKFINSEDWESATPKIL